MEWDVSVGEKGWSDNVVKYQARPRQGLLTRDGLAHGMFGNNSSVGDQLAEGRVLHFAGRFARDRCAEPSALPVPPSPA